MSKTDGYDFKRNTFAGMRVGEIAFWYEYITQHGAPKEDFFEGFKAGYRRAMDDFEKPAHENVDEISGEERA